jgi:hypothetical protein
MRGLTKKMFLTFTMFALFLNVLFSCIPASIELLAVDPKTGIAAETPFSVKPTDNNAILINIENTVYDINLQNSIKTAYNIAYKKAGKKCGVIVDFPASSSNLSGPSGGLGMALTFYKSFTEDRNFNIDKYGITGALDGMGNVLPVGGVLEKVEASLKAGKKDFIIPVTDRFDYVMLPYLYPNANINYALTFDDALSIIKSGKKTNVSNILFPNIPAFNITKNSSYNYDFNEYYNSLKEDYEKALLNLDKKIPYDAYKYYSNILEKAEDINKKGYHYTASNMLFTNGIDLLALDGLINSRDVKKEANECIEKAKSYNIKINSKNFEFMAGSLFRLSRAEQRISFIPQEKTRSATAYAIRSYAEALEWCKFSILLMQKAQEINDSEEINLTALKEYTLKILNSVNDPSTLNEEQKEFYDQALKAASKGDYLTSAFHAAYLNSYNLLTLYKKLNFESFWGRVFASQSEFYYLTGTPETGTFALAIELENIYNLALNKNKTIKQEIVEIIELNRTQDNVIENNQDQQDQQIDNKEIVNKNANNEKTSEKTIEEPLKDQKTEKSGNNLMIIIGLIALTAITILIYKKLKNENIEGKRYKYGRRDK